MFRNLIAITCLVLVFFTYGCVGLNKWRSYYYTGDLEIEEAHICEDVDEDLNPVGIKDVFNYGVKRVCLYFKYRYSDGEKILLRIRLYYEGIFVYQDSYSLDKEEGKRAYYFFLSSGEPLPRGSYEVRLMFKGKVIKALPFRIEGGGER